VNLTLAHVGGIPLEETLASLGPALLVGLGVAWAQLRARLRRVFARARARAPRRAGKGSRCGAGHQPRDAVSTLSGLARDSVTAGRWLQRG
jgi:hypothetical protein